MKRSATLDILRFVAVALVLGRHIDIYPAETNKYLNAFTGVWQRGGWVGVDLFFVLSGFLVSGLLFTEFQKRGSISPKRFLIRRGLKIYPAFYVLIALTAIDLLHSHSLIFSRLIRELLFVQNYGYELWNHTWSLAVEEHFYLLLCAGLFLVVKFRKTLLPFDKLPIVFAGVAITCLALRLLIPVGPDTLYLRVLFPTHTRIDSLLFGVLLSYSAHFKPFSISGKTRIALLMIFIAAYIPPFTWTLETTRFIYTFELSALYLGGGALLLAVNGLESRSLPARGIAFIGSRSYSIYLWHMSMALWGVRLAQKLIGLHLNWYGYAAVYLVGSIMAGIVMAEIIEFPIIRLRDRLFPSRSNSDAAKAAKGLITG